jgi:hypothetical protein
MMLQCSNGRSALTRLSRSLVKRRPVDHNQATEPLELSKSPSNSFLSLLLAQLDTPPFALVAYIW